jgi:hypothetical protein
VKDAVLGGIVVALIAVIGFLFFTKEDANAGAYNPYNVPGAMPAPGQVAPGQPAAAPAAAPAPAPATIVIKQVVAPGQPKKPAKPDAPTTPDPRVLATGNVAELMTLINSFGNPSGPDRERGCFIEVKQMVGTTVNTLAQVNEKCTRTDYPDGSYVIRRNSAEPFFNFFGGPLSLVRVDPVWMDINLFQPRAPGFAFSFSYTAGRPTADCVQADDGVEFQITVCTPNP